jgi:acyl-coenzyme A synthetase/AMP-(fatty) acid ligase
MANFEIPHHVVFLDKLPMTASGKLPKVELREEAKRLFVADGDTAAPSEAPASKRRQRV